MASSSPSVSGQLQLWYSDPPSSSRCRLASVPPVQLHRHQCPPSAKLCPQRLQWQPTPRGRGLGNGSRNHSKEEKSMEKTGAGWDSDWNWSSKVESLRLEFSFGMAFFRSEDSGIIGAGDRWDFGDPNWVRRSEKEAEVDGRFRRAAAKPKGGMDVLYSYAWSVGSDARV